MHANLMRAPGFELAFNQRKGRRASITFQQSRPGYGMAAAFKKYCLTLAVRAMAGQMRGDFHHISRFKIHPAHPS